MQRLSQDRARPRIGRALARVAATLLLAAVVSQPELAHAAPYGGGMHAGGFGGFHGGGFHDGWAAPCCQPQPLAIGTDEQPATRADARGLRYRPDGRTARAVATEPIGSWPPGAGDRPGAQRLHPEIAGNTRLEESPHLARRQKGGRPGADAAQRQAPETAAPSVSSNGDRGAPGLISVT